MPENLTIREMSAKDLSFAAECTAMEGWVSEDRATLEGFFDGVVKAVGLYERNGFRKICRSLRFSGKVEAKAHPEVRSMQEKDLPAIFDLDARYFGADRSFFLARRWRLYPELSKVLVE